MVVGTSGSGKTRPPADVIIKQRELFYPHFDKIIYVYPHWQEICTELKEKLGTINFIEGLNWNKINFNPGTDRELIIFDDVYAEASQQEEFLNRHFWTALKLTRHKNLSIICTKKSKF